MDCFPYALQKEYAQYQFLSHDMAPQAPGREHRSFLCGIFHIQGLRLRRSVQTALDKTGAVRKEHRAM